MQLFRAASPTCQEILRQLTKENESGLPPRISEDRSVDESGVDGVAVLRTDDGKASCWVQPSQETVEDFIIRESKQSGDDEIVALMNPQWRTVDDILDTLSKTEGPLSGFASFLGGKGGVLKQLSDLGFKPVYTLEGYVCRGSNVRILQTYDADWSVFCEMDNGGSLVAVGASLMRPTYQDVEAMLTAAGIDARYDLL